MARGSLISTSIPNLIGGVSQQPYSIRLATQAEECINWYPSVVEFLKRRPASQFVTQIVAAQVTKAMLHLVDRDETERYIVMITDGDLKVFDLDGVQQIVNFPNGKTYLATTAPNTKLSCLTINDYTFILNKTKTVSLNTALSTTRSPEALVFIKQASYGTTYKMTIDGTTVSTETPVQTETAISSASIAVALRTAFVALGVIAEAYTISVSNSTLWIKRVNGADFTVRVEDSRSQTHITTIKNTVQKFTDLPIIAPGGFVVKIAGDATSAFDDYYVKFVANNGGSSFDQGTWVETIKPGIKYAFNATTMPHALIRQSDGTFTFQQLTWVGRTVGDEDSSPEPSFVNHRINNLFFYRNRLSFLSGENVCMSATGEYFKFFNKTTMTTVDSDPIDVAVSHTKVSVLEHAAPFDGGLLLFSASSQFQLQHDDILSNETVAVKPITEFTASMRAAPVSTGRTVFFAVNRGAWGGVREYFAMTDGESNDAADISAHVPNYIAGNIDSLIVSSNEDILFVLSENSTKTVCVYKYFWSGNDKLQSSWSKWTFTGSILAMVCLNTTLYLLIQYPDGLYLEKINIEPGYLDPGAEWECKLDRKFTEAQASVIWDDYAQVSTVTFPYKVYNNMIPYIISRPGGADPAGIPYDVQDGDRTDGTTFIQVPGINLTNAKFYAGVKYTSTYIFSKPNLRESKTSGGQNAILEGRLQLRSMSINYHESGYFETRVTPLYRGTSIYTFTGRTLGAGSTILGEVNISSGSFKVPLLSKNDQVSILVRSDSPLPVNLVSADWEGFYNSRSTRL